MSRILCLNNYDLSGYRRPPGVSPSQFLYGVDQLHRLGHEIVIADATTRPLFAGIQKLATRMHLPIPMGDLSQQRNSLAELNSADLIYSPCDSVAWVMAYLRAVGLLRVPIILLAHHPLLHGRARLFRRPWLRLALRGIDAFPSLSTRVADEINAISGGRRLSQTLAWGPDLDFFPPYQPPGRGVVSAGRTGRDFEVLGKAGSMTNYPITMICPTAFVTPAFQSFGPNVSVLANENPQYYTYPQLIEYFAQASAIAIPMLSQYGLCGLSSLLDALAMGRAVIMTRNPLIDLDVESEGIGIWVEPGDVSGWRRAIQFVEQNPGRVEEMGVRARHLAEERFNMRIFGNQLLEIITGLLGSRSA